jgi:hypothetical protein
MVMGLQELEFSPKRAPVTKVALDLSFINHGGYCFIIVDQYEVTYLVNMPSTSGLASHLKTTMGSY